MKQRSESNIARGIRVRIRVGGHLDADWSAWFEGLSVNPTGCDETCLSGTLADQASLYGLLARIRDLGLPLLGLEVAETAGAARSVGTTPRPPSGG